ncbi:hypothetical protein L5515_003994 [Caenorhabditis briggsae]|uniref:Uncharacterized protein n=1 Tax=Caenorhabditis briggsae TaxID=6238 RepID=A0AAE9EKW0_CAEBR|nr:hypothetical protein L5515_003994 [Caenorhabditis briggsae]
MSSIELPQLMDDNLITRRKKIMQAIEDIRGKKSEIASALRELGIGKPEGNEEVKENMKQLLAAYDAISAQETQYMDILKTIVGIHEQATLDIAKDFEEKIKKDAEKLKEKKEKKEAEEEAVEEDNSEKSPEELANSEVMAELQEALLELKKVSEEAVAASELNEKLVERLQLTKKKKSAMMEVRAKKAKELDEEAARARAEVMERINKMAALKKTTGRQEKELKELQKQCLELGLTLGVDGEKEADSSATENQPKPELNEEEKEKRREEIRENIKKEMEKKEQVNTLIREKLASMDARRKRLQQIRKMLEKQEEPKEKADAVINNAKQTGEGITLTPETPRQSQEEGENEPSLDAENLDDEHVTEKSLDDILANAKANLSNLTAMRERLEHIKETGGADLNEEDVQLLEQLEHVDLDMDDGGEPPDSKKLKSEADLILSKEPDGGPEEKNDIESAVRASFHKIFQPKPLILPDSQIELLNQARRAAVEEMIRKIDEKLPSSSHSPVVTMDSVSSSPGPLSLSLLSLEASDLRELASYLLKLADLQEQSVSSSSKLLTETEEALGAKKTKKKKKQMGDMMR